MKTSSGTGIHATKRFLFAVNKALALAGVKLKRRNAATRYWPEALDNIKRLGFYPEVIVDVGVHTGTWELYSSFPKSRLILIEPMPYSEPYLQAIARRYKAEYHLVAAGSVNGQTKFMLRTGDKGASSVFAEGSSGPITELSVPMVRIDGLLKADHLGRSALLKIDVEGFELHVVEGTVGLLDHFEVVILETRFFKYSEDMAEFHEVIQRMKELGFVVYDLLDGFYRPQDKVLDLIDIIFVKSDGYLRSRISKVWSPTPDPA